MVSRVISSRQNCFIIFNFFPFLFYTPPPLLLLSFSLAYPLFFPFRSLVLSNMRLCIFYSSKFLLSSDSTCIHSLCCSCRCFFPFYALFLYIFFCSFIICFLIIIFLFLVWSNPIAINKYRAYLRDVVETAHIFFKIMERFCHGRVVVQNKGRARKKAKAKPKVSKKSSQTKTSDGENVSCFHK